MGTRGLVGFKSSGRYVTQYNHFDSYPDGLGKDVMNFIEYVREQKGWNKLAAQVQAVTLVDGKDAPSELDIARYTEARFYHSGVSTGSPKEWYALLRNTQGGDGLHAIYDGRLHHYINGIEFIKDSLFCEYAYIINLDTHKLDCYEGFQKEPQNGNEFGTTPDGDYYPCALRGSFNLDSVTFKDVKNCLESKEEE